MNQDIHSLLDNTNSGTVCESGYESVATQNVESVEEAKPNRFPQYFAAFAATLSALAAGTVLGWTSPILEELEQGHFRNISLTNDQIGWIGSFVTLGGMAICIPAGFLCDLIGRKKTLLLLIFPFTIGWLLILLAKNVLMLYFGRLITGLAAGACCIAAPLYTSEIAHKTLRGTLASYFQLMVTVGILLAYLIGKYLTALQFTIWCACLPFGFVILFMIQPESPTYLIKKGFYDEAKSSLVKLRGQLYNVDSEFNETEACLKESSRSTISLRETIRKKTVIKAFIITFALYFFQQFSGVNVIIFYTTDIFKASGTKLDPQTAAILVGVFQVITTFISSLTIDKLGRRILLLTSALLISVSTLLLAVYFTVKYRAHVDSNILAEWSFLPVTSVSIFIIAYSLGLGPIPWVIAVEVFPTEIQSITSSIGGTFNWFLAFVLTKSYLSIADVIGQDSTFYIFSFLSLAGVIFIYFVLPETKGKTNIEIQTALEN
ncbi:facilitated trehalose transporter Tret1-like [Anoplophora glabripennis]|uniref:facilitated trehalose transporter Tret1-like n=1 Tax=Anoplophora glabripennis TaxID=217634 RepID=UPI0008740719|nr:facilitated trehalose transporter Tret1-like [Anoplophora glabripennis]